MLKRHSIMAKNKVYDKASGDQSIDSDIVKGIAGGDEIAFHKLVDAFQTKLRHYIHIHAASINEANGDILQDIFIEIYSSAKRFKGQSSVNTWVYAIARNTINNKRKKKKFVIFNSNKADDVSAESTCESNINPLDRLRLSEDIELVRRCISQLDVDSQEILHLHQFSELDYASIAEVLAIKIGTVRSRLFTARKKLSQLLRAAYEHH